jgi:hypothetical protein
MSLIVYRACKLLVNGVDLSGETHMLAMTYQCDSLDHTDFGNDTHVKTGGLQTAQLTGESNPDFAGSLPGLMFDLIQDDNNVVSIFPDGITEGAACGYAMLALAQQFVMSGPVGSLATLKFTFDSQGIGLGA